jgi:hypothetical protein
MRPIIIAISLLFLISCKEEIVPLYNVDDNSKNIPEEIKVNSARPCLSAAETRTVV